MLEELLVVQYYRYLKKLQKIFSLKVRPRTEFDKNKNKNTIPTF